MKNKKLLLITSLALTAILSSCGTTTSSSSINQSSNSVSSSESSVEQYYKVNITNNDDATISVDKQTVKKGETVTITINVTNEKKLIKEVKVNDLTVTKVDDNHYSFVMVASDVTISVILENKPLENRLITINGDENIISYTLKVNDQEVNQAKEGEEVTLSVVLKNKYVLENVSSDDNIVFSSIINNSVTFTMINKAISISLISKYVPQNYKIKSFYSISPIISSIEGLTIDEEIKEGTEKNIEISVKKSLAQYYDFKFDVNYQTYSLSLDSEKSTDNVSYYKGTFTMPSDNDASIVVYPALKTASETNKIKINIDCDESQVKVLGVENNQEVQKTTNNPFSSSSSSYVVFSVTPKDGYYFDYKNDIKYITYSESNISFDSETNLFYFYASSSYKEATIKIKAHEIKQKNKITFANDKNLEVLGGLNQEINAGTPVCLKINPTNNYLINGDPSVESLTSGKYFYSSEINFDEKTSMLYFIMPICDIQFSFNLEIPTTFNVIENELIENYYFTSDSSGKNKIKSGFVGDEFYLFATPKDGYYIEYIYINDETKMTHSDWTNYYSGKIVEKRSHTNKITFDVKKYTNISYEENDAYTISLAKTKAKIGENVTATIKEKIGYHVKKVSMVGITNNIVTELTAYNGYSFSLKAPDYDVKIVVDFEKVNTYTLSFNSIEGIKKLDVVNMFNETVKSGDLINEGAKLTMTLSLENGYSVNSVKLNDLELTMSSNKYEFIMPNKNSTIIFDLHQAQKYKINFNFGEEDISTKIIDKTLYPNYYGEKETTDGQIIEGHQVKIDFTANNYYKEMNLKETTIKTASGKDVEFSSNFTTLKFTMPNEDIIISCSTKENSLLKDVYLDENATSNLTIIDSTKNNEVITSKFISGDELDFSLKNPDFKNNSYKLIIYNKPLDDETKTVVNEFDFTSTNTSTTFSSYEAIYVTLIISSL